VQTIKNFRHFKARLLMLFCIGYMPTCCNGSDDRSPFDLDPKLNLSEHVYYSEEDNITFHIHGDIKPSDNITVRFRKEPTLERIACHTYNAASLFGDQTSIRDLWAFRGPPSTVKIHLGKSGNGWRAYNTLQDRYVR